MPRVFLHIGPHKTGTSSIQTALETNADRLRAHGLHFEQFPDLVGGTHQVADFLHVRKYENARPYLERLRGITTDVVLSSENFSRLESEAVRYIAEFLKDHTVHVAFAIRHPVERVFSHWKELVKHGYCDTFSDFLARRLAAPGSDRELNDVIKLTPWADVFGHSAVSVIDYGMSDNVVEQFSRSVLGVPLELHERVNESLSVWRVEALRALCGHQVNVGNSAEILAEVRTLSEAVKDACQAGLSMTFRMSMDNVALLEIENDLAAKFGDRVCDRPPGSTRLFAAREYSWEVVNPNIWLIRKDLNDWRERLVEQCMLKFGKPAIDARLTRL